MNQQVSPVTATTVYGNGCVQCVATINRLQKQGTDFVKVDLTGNEELRDQLFAEGFRGLPIIKTVHRGTWVGFNPQKIDGLIYTPWLEEAAAA